MARRLVLSAALGLLIAGAVQAETSADWLSICSQCVSPTVVRHSGYGTANAVAEGRITRADVASWCAQWQPEDRTCLRTQSAAEDMVKTYRATADCTAGRITPVDGETYAYAGLWNNDDIGGGRSRWKDKSGQVVGRDNASNGLAISQQWELLCPQGLVRAARSAPAPAPSTAGAAYQVGQAVEAKFMSGWVHGRVTRIRPAAGGFEYDVLLENGQRGVLPPRMIRPAPR